MSVNFTKTVYRVKSTDSHESDLAVFSPTGNQPDSVPVIMFHPALGTPASYYHKFAENLCTRNGWHVAIEELRGNGSSSWRASSKVDWSYWTPVQHDIPVHVDHIRSLFPNNPFYLMGHSVGGVLLSFYLAHAFKHDQKRFHDVDGILSIASGSVYHKRHPMKIVLYFSWLVYLLTIIFGWFPGSWFGFGRREAKSFIRDWCHDVRTGIWEPSGCPTPGLVKHFKDINKPSFFLSIDKDMFVPHESTRMMVEQYPEKHSTHIQVDPKEHVDLAKLPPKLLHFRWARTLSLLPYIEIWMKQQLLNRRKTTS